MKLPIYFISDNHFLLQNDHDEVERRKKLFSFFKEIKKNSGTLVIGGDFFDFWLQSFFGVPKYYQDLIEQLKILNENKIEIHLVAGNHDYWDFGFLSKECGIKVHKNDFQFNVINKKILVTHGDGILKNDNLYRLMKKIIRSYIFIFFVRIFPSWIMVIFARIISSTPKKIGKKEILNEKYKKELQIYAKNQIEKYNFSAILMGHYHQTGIEKIGDGQFIHMGDWINNFTITILDEKGAWNQKMK
tara:strand:+ start:9871 stop:10605 length:735 start_codon:yes stop_codon:yes gene_type:complete